MQKLADISFFETLSGGSSQSVVLFNDVAGATNDSSLPSDEDVLRTLQSMSDKLVEISARLRFAMSKVHSVDISLGEALAAFEDEFPALEDRFATFGLANYSRGGLVAERINDMHRLMMKIYSLRENSRSAHHWMKSEVDKSAELDWSGYPIDSRDYDWYQNM